MCRRSLVKVFFRDVTSHEQQTVRFWCWSCHDSDLEIFNGFFLPLRDGANFTNFVRSAALAEVCAVRVLMFNDDCFANLVLRLTVKECWISAISSWSYGQDVFASRCVYQVELHTVTMSLRSLLVVVVLVSAEISTSYPNTDVMWAIHRLRFSANKTAICYSVISWSSGVGYRGGGMSGNDFSTFVHRGSVPPYFCLKRNYFLTIAYCSMTVQYTHTVGKFCSLIPHFYSSHFIVYFCMLVFCLFQQM